MNALKIPTVQTKKIIKISSDQIYSWMNKMNQQTNTHTQPSQILVLSTGTSQDIPLCCPEKACGLFNIDTLDDHKTDGLDTENMENNINIDESFFNQLTTPLSTTSSNTEFDFSFNETDFEKINSQINNSQNSSFADKIKNADLKLKVIPPQEFTFDLNMDTSLLDFDAEEVNQLITPGTQELCMRFLDDTSPANISESQKNDTDIDIDLNELLGNEENQAALIEQLLTTLATPPIQKDQNENPFLKELSAELPLANSIGKNSVELDHVYGSPSKRKLSSVFDESSNMTGYESQSDSLNTSQVQIKPTKKQRTRGIYRADDVTNEEELQNYLERRKKNNVSSKVSRANKKNQYVEMEERSSTLVVENERLRERIAKLEKATKIIKDSLIEIFSGNLK